MVLFLWGKHSPNEGRCVCWSYLSMRQIALTDPILGSFPYPGPCPCNLSFFHQEIEWISVPMDYDFNPWDVSWCDTSRYLKKSLCGPICLLVLPLSPWEGYSWASPLVPGGGWEIAKQSHSSKAKSYSRQTQARTEISADPEIHTQTQPKVTKSQSHALWAIIAILNHWVWE